MALVQIMKLSLTTLHFQELNSTSYIMKKTRNFITFTGPLNFTSIPLKPDLY